MKGRVKWFNSKRGYGFITTDEGADIYVHYTAIVSEGFRTLKHNWRVEFETITTDDGHPEAHNVVNIGKSTANVEENNGTKRRKKRRGRR
jgi:CspA family cold shock protein